LKVAVLNIKHGSKRYDKIKMLNPNTGSPLVYNKNYSLKINVNGSKTPTTGTLIFNGVNLSHNSMSINSSGTQESYTLSTFKFVPKMASKAGQVVNYGDEVAIHYDFPHMSGYLSTLEAPYCDKCCDFLVTNVINRTIFTVAPSETWFTVSDPKDAKNVKPVRQNIEFSLYYGKDAVLLGTSHSVIKEPLISGSFLTVASLCGTSLPKGLEGNQCFKMEAQDDGGPMPEVYAYCLGTPTTFSVVETNGTISYKCVQNTDCKVNEGYLCRSGQCVIPGTNGNGGGTNDTPSTTLDSNNWLHWVIIGAAVLFIVMIIGAVAMKNKKTLPQTVKIITESSK
jgi:hypothetical protein